jgi:hypothetical protein
MKKYSQEQEQEQEQEQTFTCEADLCQNSGSEDEMYLDGKYGHYYCEHHRLECSDCNERFGALKKDPLNSRNSSGYYCESCFDRNFYHCEQCDEYRDADQEVSGPTIYGARRRSDIYFGCDECSSECDCCSKFGQTDDMQENSDLELICESCVNDYFSYCETCNKLFKTNETWFVDGGSYCEDDYSESFFYCEGCDTHCPKDEGIVYTDEGAFCRDCAPPEGAKEIPQQLNKMNLNPIENVSFHASTRGIERLQKYIDQRGSISIKDFKLNFPQLETRYKDLILMAKGKPITAEMLKAFEEKHGNKDYGVSYSTWSGMQRSHRQSIPQLVLHIEAQGEVLDALNADEFYLLLFEKINQASKQSKHPHSSTQIGWARLELDRNKEFILVDEIQCDHMGAAFNILKGSDEEICEVGDELKRRFNLSNDEFAAKIKKYVELTSQKDFPNIADKAIVQFARQNGFKKIYWHEYESGKKLKAGSDPPMSLYTDIPRQNGYVLTDEKPFGLDGKFLVKEAKMNISKLVKLARSLYMKYAYLA